MRSRFVSALGICGLALLLTVVMTWPLAPRMDRMGRTNTGDGHYSLWNVAWVAHALTSAPSRLYHANIFHPHPYTLAYSEANIGAGTMAIPVWLATRNPFAAHNSVVLTAFVLSFLCTFALARYVGAGTGLAICAGIAFAYCPFIFARTAHIQLLMTFGIPLSLLAMHRLIDRPSGGRALALGVALWAQALLCAYYGILLGLVVGLGVLFYGVTRGLWRRPRYWAATAGAAVVAVGLVLPFFLPFMYVQQELGFARTLHDADMYSADWRAWLASAAWAHRWMLPLLESWKEVLFPGFLTTAAGLAGAVIAWRSGNHGEHTAVRPRETAGFYALAGGLVFWSSFGPAAGLYTAFYHTIPVFSFLRAPSRFGILVTLALIMCAAAGLGRWLQSRPPTTRRRLAVAGAVLITAELARMPLQMPEAQPVNPAYRFLARLPRGPVVELPFFWERNDFPRHARYMFNSTYHWQPLINGYSDHIPGDFREMVVPVSSFPTLESFELLKARRTRYAVFHLGMYDERSRLRLMERLEVYEPYLYPLSREDHVWLFEIVAWPE
jgi:uncharacterized membrane protein YozB (DUF420 family)